MNLTNDLKDFLAKSGWTQVRLATESGVAQPTLSKILSGKRVWSDKIELLYPYLYGDKRPHPSDEQEAA